MKQTPIMENDDRAVAAIGRWDEGKSDPERARSERDWEDISGLIRPQRGGFTMGHSADRTLVKPLSSVPIMANNGHAAGLYSAITNPSSRWAGLQTPDKEFNTWKPMAEWLDLVERRVMNSFSASMSGFYPSSYQAYADVSAFGNAVGYDQIDLMNRKFIDVTLSLSEFVVWIDFHGRVDEGVRKFRLSARAAMQEFGKDALPKKLQDYAADGKPDLFDFYQHVKKNYDFQKGKLGPKGKRWLSHTACEVEKALVRVKGYEEMPFYWMRWDVDSGMKYGTGGGLIALPSARVNQLLTDAQIRAAQYAADPTKLAPDSDTIPINGVFRPGEVIHGGVNSRGTPMIQNLDNGANYHVTEAEQRKVQEEIKEVFQYSVMGLQGRTGMTTEETQIIEEARLRNWAPHADRIMEEYAARKVERRFAMLWRAGQIPPPPAEAEGLPLQVRYQSAATQALKAREGLAIRSFLNDLGPLIQLDPRFGDRISPDDLTEAMHDASPALPASILRSREEADAIAQGRAEQEAQAAQMQQMQAGGGVAKDVAQAAGALPEGALEAMAGGMVQ